MKQSALLLMMMDEAVSNGARLKWTGDDTVPDLGDLLTRKFEFTWQ